METSTCHMLMEKAQKLVTQRRIPEALKVLDEALQDLPDSARLWELKGAALHALNQFPPARDALEQATTLAPLSASGQLVLADCYHRLGSTGAADCMYDFLVGCAGRLPVGLLSKLASNLGARGRFQQAVNVCRCAVERQPDCDQAAFGLAYYMGKAGFAPQRALPMLRRAFQLAPNRMTYRLALALALHRCRAAAEAYQLVANLQMDDIARMTCRSCTGRLMQIYEQAEDFRRCNWCRARAQILD